MESNNGAISDILAEVLTTLGNEMDKEIKTLCLSGEEMIVGMERVNNLSSIRKLVAMSMDVEKLYPSLKADKVAKVAAAEYKASKLNIEVDTMALSQYLAGRSW